MIIVVCGGGWGVAHIVGAVEKARDREAGNLSR